MVAYLVALMEFWLVDLKVSCKADLMADSKVALKD
jgi:hypothetical protein